MAAVEDAGEFARIGRAPTDSGASGEREPKPDWMPAAREAAANPSADGLDDSRLRWLAWPALVAAAEMGTPWLDRKDEALKMGLDDAGEPDVKDGRRLTPPDGDDDRPD